MCIPTHLPDDEETVLVSLSESLLNYVSMKTTDKLSLVSS